MGLKARQRGADKYGELQRPYSGTFPRGTMVPPIFLSMEDGQISVLERSV